jgi:hypothetical protein
MDPVCHALNPTRALLIYLLQNAIIAISCHYNWHSTFLIPIGGVGLFRNSFGARSSTAVAWRCWNIGIRDGN